MEPKPTIGRQVRTQFRGEECTATICHVWNDECVNLVVMDHSGCVHPFTSVQLSRDPLRQEYTWWWPERS